MADGSVVIGVSLDTTNFTRSIELIESRVKGLGSLMSYTLSSSLSGEQFYTSVTSAFERIASSVSTSFSGVFSTVTDAASNAVTTFEDGAWEGAGLSASTGISEGMLAGYQAISSAASSIMQKIKEEFSSGWFEIGRNVSAGIASGIAAGEDDVAEAADRVATGTVNTLKKHYMISSPSALMRDEIGVMISRGIAEGITEGASYINAALNDVYSSDRALSGRERESTRQNNLTQNIYLRDTDYSPYKTAKRIRRESEAILDI